VEIAEAIQAVVADAIAVPAVQLHERFRISSPARFPARSGTDSGSRL
jgi:hypothetical protein